MVPVRPALLLLFRVLLVVASTTVTVAALEAGYRIWKGLPVLAVTNWREARLAPLRAASPSMPDAQLGWTMRSWVSSTGFNTLDLGIRSNGIGEAGVRMHGILAVGDSFTAGSEVVDGESWPAYLEQQLGEPVLNAGVGGYGTDQIILRAEQLLPIVRPHTLIVGFLVDDISRSAFSTYGQPKPYFTFEGDALQAHEISSPTWRDLSLARGSVARALLPLAEHSAVADRIMAGVAPTFWFLTADQRYVEIDVDPVRVTCALLDRLQQQTKRQGVRSVLFMQYGARIYTTIETRSAPAEAVLTCAARAGFTVVDEFDSLKAEYRRDPARLDPYYVGHEGVHGHMSAQGNRHAARLIAEAIAPTEPRPASMAAIDHPLLERGDLPAYDDLLARASGTPHASLEASADRTTGADSSYRLAARGNDGEHYAVLAGLPSPPGRHLLTAEFEPEGTDSVRVVVLDGRNAFFIADVNLSTGTAQAVGDGERNGRIEVVRGPDGWVQARVSADFPAPGRTILLQLRSPSGLTAFPARGESVRIRALRLQPAADARLTTSSR